jgi:Subtilase family
MPAYAGSIPRQPDADRFSKEANMTRRWLLVTACIFSLLIGGEQAVSQESTHEIIGIETKDPADLRRIQAILMEYAGPVPARVESGDTYNKVISRECPSADEFYRTSALEQIRTLNHVEITDLNAEVPSDRVDIYIPYCVDRNLEPYVVQDKDNLWNLYRAQIGSPHAISNWSTFKEQFQQLNKEILPDDLLAGQSITIPKTEVRIPIPKDSASEAIGAIRNLPRAPSVELKAPPNWGVLEADAMDDECGSLEGDAHDEASTFRDIARALGVNIYLDDHYTWDRSEARAVIALLDAGAQRTTSPIMKYGRKKITRSVLDRDIEALPSFNKKFHGSGVMSVAIGGPLLAQLSPLYRLVETAPYRIIDEECRRNAYGAQCDAHATEERLNRGLKLATKSDSPVVVVNLSVSFPREIFDFQEYLGSKIPYLIVAAAGNNLGVLSEDNAAYPAMKGGDDLSNIVTVAGLTLDGDIMVSSNRSSKYVDIGALGCRVPVLEYDDEAGDFTLNRRTGTSYAAPQVSFAAAVLASEHRADSGGVTPFELKKRLIYSSDLKVELWNSIRHGRVLNLAKAFSVYSDVVELTDGRLIWGKVSFGAETADDSAGANVDLCSDVSLKRGAIKKIAQLKNFEERNELRRYFIYAEDQSLSESSERKIETYWCQSIFTDLSITDAISGKSLTLDSENVRDIVFASYPYWE